MVCLEPIGVAHTPWTDRWKAPRQGCEEMALGRIELDPRWVGGLEGLRPGRWLWVLCHLDRAEEPQLLLHPRGDRSRPLTGLFNSRSPARPCPICLELVRLEALDGNLLTVRGLDVLDGTPVLDLKPYLPELDRPREE